MTETPTSLPPWFELARRALWLASRDELERAVRTVERMAREHGVGAVPEAMQAWMDTVLRARGLPVTGEPVTLTFVEPGTGQISGADDVTPEWAWAGRLIAARAADDPDTYRALIDSVPDNAVWSRRVTTVLVMCAVNLRGRPLSLPEPRGG